MMYVRKLVKRRASSSCVKQILSRIQRKQPILRRRIVPVPTWMQTTPPNYCGYKGPWLEAYFYDYIKQLGYVPGDRIYMPLQWTNNWGRDRTKHTYEEWQAHAQALADKLSAKEKYFTISNSDNGTHVRFKVDMLEFSAGGKGHIPVPLLKKDLSALRTANKRDIRVAFLGAREGGADIAGVRARMYEVMHKYPGCLMDRYELDKYIETMARCVFMLCPRGFGRTSYRLYEALQLGTIPIYIWDDVEWLPYKELFDWSEFAISLNVDSIGELPDILDSITEQRVAQMQDRILELNPYFTYNGTCEYICNVLRGFASAPVHKPALVT